MNSSINAEYDSKLIQEKLLNQMRILHNIFEKNNLKYFLCGGSCLGARRHSGFIPWDDDMDIAMPREDYERFETIAKEVLPSYLEIKYYKNTQKSPIHYIKVIDNTTTLIEKEYHYYIEGIYIDVFPIDGVNKNSRFFDMRCKVIWNVHSMIMNHCSNVTKKSIKGKIKKAISKIINLKLLHMILESLITKYKYSSSEDVAMFLGAYGKKEIFPKEYFGNPKLVEFEDSYFYVPEKTDEYLNCVYGNFMELPPIEERICKHQYYFLDLNQPYKTYKNGDKNA